MLGSNMSRSLDPLLCRTAWSESVVDDATLRASIGTNLRNDMGQICSSYIV